MINLVELMKDTALKVVTPLLPTYTFGTVTGTSPLQVLLDGETEALAASPLSLVSVATGDRVEIRRSGRQAVITANVSRRFIYAGDPGSTDDAALILRRVSGESQLEYMFQAGISEQANIIIRDENGDNHAVLRIGRNGQILMNTAVQSGSGAASRPLPFAIAVGSTSITGDGTSTNTAAATFPSGRFTSAPEVFTTIASNASSAAFHAAVPTISTSGCTIRLSRDPAAGTYSSTYSVRWLAIQLEA